MWARDRTSCLVGETETVGLAITPSKKVMQSSITGNRAWYLIFNITNVKRKFKSQKYNGKPLLFAYA